MDLLKRLNKSGLLNTFPKFLLDNTMYATYMGSVAYGVSNLGSDVDIYGFCLPPKENIFPHLAGEIPGFGSQIQRFNQFQQHHIKDKSTDKEYDITIFSIVKYFQLCMENNPNIIDSLFVPRTCIMHSTAISEHVRENRKLFLHKGAYYKFKGYSYSQMHKMKTKVPQGLSEFLEFEKEHRLPKNTCRSDVLKELYRRECGSPLTETTLLTYLTDEQLKKYDTLFDSVGVRTLDTKIHGYDLKFSYHIVRLLSECEQILVEGDINLQKNNEQLKSIRRGEWSLEQIEQYFVDKEKQLEELYIKSTLQHKPDEDKIKALLLECLEMHYGSLEKAVYIAPDLENDLKMISKIVNKYNY